MTFKKYFYKAILARYPQRGSTLLAAIEARFTSLQPDIAFALTSKNPVDRRMKIAAYFLACIEVLDKAGEPHETIRNLMLEIATNYVQPKNFIHRASKKIPLLLLNTWVGKWLIQLMANRTKQLSHPDGFRVSILTDKNETLGLGYGFDILECGICKLYQKHKLQKFTSLLCEIDHITSSLAGLTIKRSGTIALGAEKCDFRFERKN